MAKHKGRAPRGQGSVFYSTARGLWVARKPVGRNGTKTVYLTRTGRTQAEAIRRRDAALPPGPATTVAAWAETWLADCEVREQTRDAYRQSVELRIGPQLGPKRVAEVTPYDVERAAKEWGSEVAANTVRKHLGHLRTLFSAARRAGLVATNPVSLSRKPKGTKVEIDPFTEDELARVVAAAAKTPRTHRLAVMAATGLRLGEAIALVPGDYDAATGLLSIRRTATVSHGDGPPKSANSKRTIRVPLSARAPCANLGPVLNHKAGGARWRALLAQLGLRDRGPHQARHSVASIAIARGVPIANVARDLGDTVGTIVATYLHPVPGRDVSGCMDEVLGADGVPAPGAKPPRAPGIPAPRKKPG